MSMCDIETSAEAATVSYFRTARLVKTLLKCLERRVCGTKLKIECRLNVTVGIS